MDYVTFALKLIDVCQSAMLTFRTIRPYLWRFTSTEHEILRAIGEKGEIRISVGGNSCLFLCGSIQADSHEDPQALARLLRGFECLCARGLIRPMQDDWFMLTEEGFALACRVREGKRLSRPWFWWWRLKRWLRNE